MVVLSSSPSARAVAHYPVEQKDCPGAPMTCPTSSFTNGIDQPRFSGSVVSALPGASTTPSKVMNRATFIFLTLTFPFIVSRNMDRIYPQKGSVLYKNDIGAAVFPLTIWAGV